jgi:hypothetical protein
MSDAVMRVVLFLTALGVLGAGALAGLGAVAVGRSAGLLPASFIGVMATLVTGFGAWLTWSALTDQFSPQAAGGFRPAAASDHGEEDAGWDDGPAAADASAGDWSGGDWDLSD